MGEVSSQRILRDIFMISYIFKLECEINKIENTERVALARKLGTAFTKPMLVKIKILDLWRYPNLFYHHYLEDFMN
jgi:hypothetical protein